jgi:hypothetical protein
MPAAATWRVGNLQRVTRAEIPVAQASLFWTFDAAVGGAGPTATLAATLLVQVGDAEPAAWGTGRSAAFAVMPGGNRVEVALAPLGAASLPAEAFLAVEVVLKDAFACGANVPVPTARADESGVEFDAPRDSRFTAQVTGIDMVTVSALLVPDWGGYDIPPPPEVFLGLEGPEGSISEPMGELDNHLKLVMDGERSFAWSRSLADLAPGRYQGHATAFTFHDPEGLDVPVVFRVTLEGGLQTLPILQLDEPAPAVPLPLLAAILLALAYSSARRSATALRTSLPW